MSEYTSEQQPKRLGGILGSNFERLDLFGPLEISGAVLDF